MVKWLTSALALNAIVLIASTAAVCNGDQQMQREQEDRAARDIAREYVHRSKGWSDSEFNIEILRREDNGIVVVDAVHVDDLRSKGSNKSVQLYVDIAKRQVVKELGYQ